MKYRKKSKPSKLKKEIIRHTSGTFLLKVLGLFLRLVTGVVLARGLGASGYGVYAFPMAIVALLSIPATAGLPQLLVRSVSRYLAKEEYGLLRGLLIRSNQFVLAVSALFAAGALLVYYAVTEVSINSPEGLTFFISMGLLPLVALNSVRIAVLSGFRKVVLGQIPEAVIKPILFLSLTICFLFFPGKDLSPSSAMIFQVLATSAALVFGIFFLIKHQPVEIRKISAEYKSLDWFKSAVPFMFLGMMQVINKQTDIVMLGMLKSSADVGIYRAVVHASMLVTFVLTAVNQVIGPQIARLWALEDLVSLQRILTTTARVVALGSIITSMVLILFGGFFLNLFFGAEFVEGLWALRILCFGQIINGLAGSVGNILNMTGYERIAVKAVGIAALINIILNVILVPMFGIEGAAIATAVSLVCWNSLLIVWVVKKTGLHSTAFGII